MSKKRKGRPASQNVKRYACGKIRREYRAPRGETEVQIRATVLEYRKRNVGEADAGRNEAGYELGRMMLAGKVSRRQHEAGCAYALLVADYQRCIGFPAPYPQGIDLGAARGIALGGEVSDDRIRRTANQYMRAITALFSAGRAADRAVREVCVYDRGTQDLHGLNSGLDSLAIFFGIPAD
ncbi:hypothetical protein [Xanthobacter autotrophicus]|uniref:hypothetical protein n=1 Tax=Xanthobacter autotrophicus TaxID=280 RepID=UPI0037278977